MARHDQRGFRVVLNDEHGDGTGMSWSSVANWLRMGFMLFIGTYAGQEPSD